MTDIEDVLPLLVRRSGEEAEVESRKLDVHPRAAEADIGPSEESRDVEGVSSARPMSRTEAC